MGTNSHSHKRTFYKNIALEFLILAIFHNLGSNWQFFKKIGRFLFCARQKKKDVVLLVPYCFTLWCLAAVRFVNAVVAICHAVADPGLLQSGLSVVARKGPSSSQVSTKWPQSRPATEAFVRQIRAVNYSVAKLQATNIFSLIMWYTRNAAVSTSVATKTTLAWKRRMLRASETFWMTSWRLWERIFGKR